MAFSRCERERKQNKQTIKIDFNWMRMCGGVDRLVVVWTFFFFNRFFFFCCWFAGPNLLTKMSRRLPTVWFFSLSLLFSYNFVRAVACRCFSFVFIIVKCFVPFNFSWCVVFLCSFFAIFKANLKMLLNNFLLFGQNWPETDILITRSEISVFFSFVWRQKSFWRFNLMSSQVK